MSGYLSKLALRAKQQQPSIRPRLGSLFEPASEMRLASFSGKRLITEGQPANVLPQPERRYPVLNEIEPESPTIRTLTPEPGNFRPPAPVVREVSVERSRETTVSSQRLDGLTWDEKRADKTTLETASMSTSPAPAVDARNHDSPVHEQTWPQPLVAYVVETKIIESLIQADSPSTAAAETKRTEPPFSGSPVIVRPSVTAVPSPVSASDVESRETASAIRITIGRVEVRAVMPSTPAPTAVVAASPKQPSALSLEEYLKKRSGE